MEENYRVENIGLDTWDYESEFAEDFPSGCYIRIQYAGNASVELNVEEIVFNRNPAGRWGVDNGRKYDYIGICKRKGIETFRVSNNIFVQ